MVLMKHGQYIWSLHFLQIHPRHIYSPLGPSSRLRDEAGKSLQKIPAA